MSDHIDWLHSSRGVCKVHVYTPKGQQEQDRIKVISFVDVADLKTEDRDAKNAAGSSSKDDCSLKNLEDKEIIVIKNTEKQHKSKTGGSVCLFKQAPFDPISALNFLLNDLQKYALGFQHALSPTASSCKLKIGASEDECHELPLGNCYSVFADQLNTDYFAKRPHSLRLEMAGATNTNDDQNSSTLSVISPSSQRALISPEGECSLEDLSFQVNRLYSLIMQMARKEVTEKLEGGSKCSTGDKGKDSPCSVRSKIDSEIAHDAVDATSTEMWGPGKEGREGSWKPFTCSQLSNSNKGRGQEMCQEDSKDFADSISKGLVVRANQVASDMMVSIMRTLKCHSSERPVPAWVILKRVLLNHSKEIVSDLIDSCMRNLHGITGVLMTDSEFVSAVKRNLFNYGKQNAAAIMDTMLKCLFSDLLGENSTKSQSLTYVSLKTGSPDHKCNNQSLECGMKAETEGKGKVRPEQCTSLSSAEKGREHLLKETLTRWKQNQGKRADKSCTNKEEKREKISPSTDSLAKELIVTALALIRYHLSQQAKGKDSFEGDAFGSTMGYMAHSTQYEKCGSWQSAKALSMKRLEAPEALEPSTALKENQQLDCLKVDMSKLVLRLIQKLLNESPFDCDIFEGENKRSESQGNKAASKRPDRREEGCQENEEHEFMSRMKQVNGQFLDKLVESVMKLCLFMANYSSNGAVVAELEKQIALLNNPNYPTGSSRSGRDSGSSNNQQDLSEFEIVVNNPSATSRFQKQLQAVLQWIAASQYNVPTLYFTADDEGQLEKLPEVSAKAAEKGYSVGDLLQEVIKFAKEQQLDETPGNMAKNQLLNWLLANL
ncbi:A-kinase anchor protein 4-like [Rhynchocyon petersi]